MRKFFVFMALFALLLMVSAAAQGSQAQAGLEEDNPELMLISAGPEESGEGAAYQVREQIRAMVQEGTFMNQAGEQMRLRREENNRMRLEVGGISAECPLCDGNMVQEMVQERMQLRVELSNGRNAEIKIMPDAASEKALERLRLRVCNENCTIELKEVGAGAQTRAAYEVKAQKQAKVLGLFRAKMQVNAQVDAESGEIIKSGKPWWAFLAVEAEE